MTAPPRAWALVAELCVSFGFACIVYVALRLPAAALVGPRGARRSEARDKFFLLRVSEPLLRALGAWIGRWPIARLRTSVEVRLRQAGSPLGLGADELIALSVLGAPLGAALGSALAPMFQLDETTAAALAAALAGMGPFARVRQCRVERQRQISRDLPTAIDLLALCMSAGLDFTSALHLWLERSADKTSALARELAEVALALTMGHTRRDALRAFAEAVPTVTVIDFVNTVIQAEQKGTPLATAIEIQARMLRMQRSVAAEHAAARAAVWLLLPLLLLLGAIMLLLFSPFLINGTGL